MSKRNMKKKYNDVSFGNDDVYYIQHRDGTITVTIRGKVAENLHKAAEAMNTVPWCDGDNEGVSVLADFAIWHTMNNWGEKSPHYAFDGLVDETGLICDAIDTGADGDEELDKKRKAELSAAFDKAFNFEPVPGLAKPHTSDTAD